MNIKKNLAIIGASYLQLPLIQKAKELGYTTHVFAWAANDVGEKEADFFYPISIIEKDKILAKCKELNICGICSIASDLAAITVNFVAENLGLPCNKTEFVPIQTNKYKMRTALMNAEIPCPKFILADENFTTEQIKDFSYPIIVKPTDRSGSRCITKLENPDGIYEAIKAASNVSFEKKAIVEEFIEGDEYSMETVTQNGVHNYLATTKKFTTGSPNFIETGHRQPCGLPDNIQQKAISHIMKALDALHIENSAGHSEFKVDENGNIRIIEIGARMGGDCIGSDLVYLSTGHDFVKMVIDIAVGKPIEFNPVPTNHTVEVHFLLTQEDINEMYRLKAEHPEKIYRISPLELENLGKTEDSGTRVGCYITL